VPLQFDYAVVVPVGDVDGADGIHRHSLGVVEAGERKLVGVVAAAASRSTRWFRGPVSALSATISPCSSTAITNDM
jgi:hypothetical protein